MCIIEIVTCPPLDTPPGLGWGFFFGDKDAGTIRKKNDRIYRWPKSLPFCQRILRLYLSELQCNCLGTNHLFFSRMGPFRSSLLYRHTGRFRQSALARLLDAQVSRNGQAKRSYLQQVSEVSQCRWKKVKFPSLFTVKRTPL